MVLTRASEELATTSVARVVSNFFIRNPIVAEARQPSRVVVPARPAMSPMIGRGRSWIDLSSRPQFAAQRDAEFLLSSVDEIKSAAI